ncbi:hypothetical protein [Pseudorhizobium tarimense]
MKQGLRRQAKLLDHHVEEGTLKMVVTILLRSADAVQVYLL